MMKRSSVRQRGASMVEFAVLVVLVILTVRNSLPSVGEPAANQFCRGGLALRGTTDITKVYYKVSTKECCVRNEELGGDICFGGTGF